MRLLLCLAVASATSVLLVAVPRAQACSCAPPPDASIAFQGSKFVFEGSAGAVTDVVGTDSEAPAGFGMKQVSFEILRSWKGGLEGTVTVKTAASSAACGRSYTPGAAYILYAGTNEAGEPTDNRTHARAIL